jgi:DNA-binding beta-propeller fold protein YncE
MTSRRWLVSAIGLIGLGVATVWGPAPMPSVAAQTAAPQTTAAQSAAARRNQKDLLYVGVHGTQGFPDAFGDGILVFDVANNFRFVKRIPSWSYPASQQNEGVRGIAASTQSGLIYITTAKRIGAFDLATEKKVWEGTYDGFCCDRMALSPDSKTLYIPQWTGKREKWYVVDALTGALIKEIPTPQTLGSHNTIYSLDGSRVFMEGIYSHYVNIADPKTHTIVRQIGPFSDNVRPFTINGRGTLVVATVENLLGFEIADVTTGKMIHRVEVDGYGWRKDRITGHGTPSHGVAFSPDEKEIWVTDGVNGFLHVFDATVMPPKQIASIPTREHPYWITFGLDGKYVYPSSGDIIDAASKKVIAGLRDEYGRAVESEKILEILFVNGKPTRVVDQFGVGLVRGPSTN